MDEVLTEPLAAQPFVKLLLSVFAGLGVAPACASVPIMPEGYQALARADRLVLDGCYDCLLEARAAYQGLAAGKTRPLVLLRLFETDLLLAIREKEPALPSESTLARATALAGELPASLGAQRYLEMVGLVPENNVGAPELDRDAFYRERPDAPERVDQLLAGIETDTLSRAFRQYVTLSLHCSYIDRGRRADRPPASTSTSSSA